MVSETSSGGAELADVVLGEEKFWMETRQTIQCSAQLLVTTSYHHS